MPRHEAPLQKAHSSVSQERGTPSISQLKVKHVSHAIGGAGVLEDIENGRSTPQRSSRTPRLQEAGQIGGAQNRSSKNLRSPRTPRQSNASNNSTVASSGSHGGPNDAGPLRSSRTLRSSKSAFDGENPKTTSSSSRNLRSPRSMKSGKSFNRTSGEGGDTVSVNSKSSRSLRQPHAEEVSPASPTVGSSSPSPIAKGGATPVAVTRKMSQTLLKGNPRGGGGGGRRSSTTIVTSSGVKVGVIVLDSDHLRELVVANQMGQPELKQLKLIFCQKDIENVGEISKKEFFEIIDEPSNFFTLHIFTLLELPPNGDKITFDDFLEVVVKFCTLSKNDVLRFAFEVVDADHSMALDEGEFKKLLDYVNDKNPVFPGNFSKALEEFDKNHDNVIDWEEFQDLNKHYPMLLFPAFRLQDNMRRNTLGLNKWVELGRRVSELEDKKTYMATHNGMLPPLSLIQKLKHFFGVGLFTVYDHQRAIKEKNLQILSKGKKA